ncbi:hypothetical protein QR685DRAFT_536074 [Neurospora intermedia]|uniref:Secreted protein n=1 Tax=Neurospora intermedia TaxID=5142 RepID=A0ABR3D0N8_NEUIN
MMILELGLWDLLSSLVRSSVCLVHFLGVQTWMKLSIIPYRLVQACFLGPGLVIRLKWFVRMRRGRDEAIAAR